MTNPKLEGSAEDASRTVVIAEDGGFSVAVGADEGDSLLLEVRDASGEIQLSERITALQSGSGPHAEFPAIPSIDDHRPIRPGHHGPDGMGPPYCARASIGFAPQQRPPLRGCRRYHRSVLHHARMESERGLARRYG